jgi:hypothetical protein
MRFLSYRIHWSVLIAFLQTSVNTIEAPRCADGVVALQIFQGSMCLKRKRRTARKIPDVKPSPGTLLGIHVQIPFQREREKELSSLRG